MAQDMAMITSTIPTAAITTFGTISMIPYHPAKEKIFKYVIININFFEKLGTITSIEAVVHYYAFFEKQVQCRIVFYVT